MVRFKFFLAFLALLICVGGIAGAYFYWKKFAEPEIGVVKQIDGTAEFLKEKPDLGKRHFDEAVELLKEGELVSARDRLRYLMTYFPESGTFDEARRVVGEINLDLLVSNIPLPKKTIYKVSRGDALVTIARRTETTIDYIMRANGKTTALIYPDEELVVYPLDFRVEIDLEKELVIVFDDDRFFKEYRIIDTNLPPGVKAPTSTTVQEKVAWFGDQPLNFADANYLNCSKWMRTGKIGLFIREGKGDGEESDSNSYGVMVAKADMEELFTILRTGAKVSLVK
ncbi:MAG: LysM domain-containing protein [Verrucomicrobiales bacterium]|nr:LysM domain-containing protein [Verrucomicrobiales bacterium]